MDIRESGSVEGDVSAPRVAIADGAHFRGSIDMQRAGRRHVELGLVEVGLLGQRKDLQRLGARIEPDGGGLVHVAEPEVALRVGADRQRAGREARLAERDRKSTRLNSSHRT